jgi:hypothetical protein
VARAAVSKMLRLLMGFSEMEIPRWDLGVLLHDFSFHAAKIILNDAGTDGDESSIRAHRYSCTTFLFFLFIF